MYLESWNLTFAEVRKMLMRMTRIISESALERPEISV